MLSVCVLSVGVQTKKSLPTLSGGEAWGLVGGLGSYLMRRCSARISKPINIISRIIVGSGAVVGILLGRQRQARARSGQQCSGGPFRRRGRGRAGSSRPSGARRYTRTWGPAVRTGVGCWGRGGVCLGLDVVVVVVCPCGVLFVACWRIKAGRGGPCSPWLLRSTLSVKRGQGRGILGGLVAI